ncbi:hypothetical protein PsorP6_002558 [Peronosclerospora sorghi]|uniref:Uncharacterized protein n=1 Tax=Peronosclerospora sorghi TaxID=230839 RepID=A0ACC0WTW5_9STRA|nr:hypothetical protein PsorP6_002558 [Peronosclerospora sorghi]
MSQVAAWLLEFRYNVISKNRFVSCSIIELITVGGYVLKAYSLLSNAAIFSKRGKSEHQSKYGNVG